jgi:hypothetical protein
VVRQVATPARWQWAAAILAAVALASCGYLHRHPTSRAEVNPPRTWFLLVAPFTREFPHGDLHAPFSQWSQVRTFDTGPGCDAMLEQAEDVLQRPVQCIASDNPQLKGPPPGSESKP